ncbi:MAG: RidA family protein [Elusimicrobiota bacterium]
MKNETIRRSMRSGIDVRVLRGGSHTEYFLTATVEERPAEGSPESVRAVFSDLAGILLEEGIQPVRETVYGRRGAREEILGVRKSAYLDQGMDPTPPGAYLDGAPPCGAEFGGAQIWGIAPKANDKAAVSTVDCPGGLRGRLWTGSGFRFLHVPAVRGTDADGRLPAGCATQAERMFENAREAVESHGFKYTNVVRTWIYVRRLLDWYDDLNKVRNALYQRPGYFGRNGSPRFPASTGIQGRLLDEECVMDVLALDCNGSGGIEASPILTTAKQGQAFSYRSAFARGMALRAGKRRTIHVSGTASINGAGETIHKTDAEAQSLQTLMSVAAVLEQQGAGLENICSSTVFCKDVEAYEAFRRAARLLRVPRFPAVFVLADVCRHDLLVEVEAVAVVGGGAAAARTADGPAAEEVRK